MLNIVFLSPYGPLILCIPVSDNKKIFIYLFIYLLIEY